MIYVDIVSDTICPWCYIGKRRFERALQISGRTDVALSWRPFQLNPDMPREGMDRAEYMAMKFGSGRKADEIYRRVTEAGVAEGIDFRFDKIKRTPNTTDAHRLLLYAQGAKRQEAMLNRLFEGYFTEGADIGDTETLITLAGDAESATRLGSSTPSIDSPSPRTIDLAATGAYATWAANPSA